MQIIPKESVLDYEACQYGTSRLTFRGPKQALDAPYVAFLGGSEVYGRFIDRPMNVHVEKELGIKCANFGCKNASVDAFLQDPAVCALASEAAVTVIQITGAQNISNRFYRVHPRFNDRFVAPAASLKALYPDLDFTNIHFCRHALREFYQASATRFELIVDELKAAWVARMIQLLETVKGRKILFWMGAHGIDTADENSLLDPLYVDRDMVEALRPYVDEIVEYVASRQACQDGTRGMIFSSAEKRAAQHMFGPRAHREVAKALVKVLEPMVGKLNRCEKTIAA